MAQDGTQRRLLGIRPLTASLVCVYLAGFVACAAVSRGAREAGATWNITDFDVFYMAGGLARAGEAATAYDFAAFARHQIDVAGTAGTLPYAYPPPFGMLTWALAGLAEPWAFAALVGLSTAALVAVLRGLAGRHWGGVLLMGLPAILAGLWNGQTGTLCAALAGLSAWSLAEGRARGGLPLGALVVKPHLAVGLGLVALLGGAWRAALVAVAAALALGLAATAAFGPAIWPAFARGASTSSALLAEGSFPLNRMVSVYALLRSLGVAAGVALAFHAGVAVAALGAALAAWRRGWQPRRAIALAVTASLLVSPYAYDYDLAMMAIALALVAPDLAAAPRAAWGLTALAWAAGIYPYASGWVVYRDFLAGGDVSLAARPVAWGGLAFLALALGLAAKLREAEADSAVRAEPAPA